MVSTIKVFSSARLPGIDQGRARSADMFDSSRFGQLVTPPAGLVALLRGGDRVGGFV
jgi:hypothetical protein